VNLIRKIGTTFSLLRIASSYATPISVIQTLLTPRFTKKTVTLFGKPFSFTDQASFLKTTDEIFIKKLYEYRSSATHPIIFDCGANIGLSVLFFKRMLPNATVIAYEPEPETFEVLQVNVKSQNLQGVQLYQAAVWTHDGSISFVQEGGESSHILSEKDVSNSTSDEVKCVRLQTAIEKYESVDFLKIDIEGAEIEVMKDIAPVLSRCNNVFVEYHSFEGQPQQLSTIIDVLVEAGFRYKVQEAYAPKQPFLDKSTHANGMDLQLNIFAYRNA
jgi:FkbM family methyltransferase